MIARSRIRLPARRDVLIFGSGFLCGMFLAPLAVVHAQVTGATSITGLPAPDSGTAGVLTKFFTDLGRRFFAGERAAPEWFPLALATVLGPVITALITLASGVPLSDPATIAKVILGGFIAGTAVAVLLTQGHSASHAPEVNLPPVVAALSTPLRSTLCCTHPDCTNSQAQAQTLQAQTVGVATDAIPTPSTAAPIVTAPVTVVAPPDPAPAPPASGPWMQHR